MKNFFKNIILVLCWLTACCFPFYTSAQIHTATIINVQHVSCYGGSNGAATVNITPNPASPCGSHTISWSNGSNSPVISGLATGIYFVNVTDNCSGLTVFDIIVINEPPQLTSFITVTDVLCKGMSTGKLDLTVTGGTPGPAPNFYNFTWTPTSAVTEDLANVPAGTYNVSITDSKGCMANNFATITEPAQSLSSSNIAKHVSCTFGSDGEVNLTVWGGVPPYFYDWNSGTFSSEDVTGLLAGTHNVVIRDKNNCPLTENILITEPPLLTSSITGTSVLCFGNSDGSVDLTVNGGTPPYKYSWTSTNFTLGNTQDLANVPADSYTVTITDAKDCITTNNYVVTQPAVLQSTISSVNVSCFGFSDGSIDLNPTGGSPPYSFTWSNSAGLLPYNTEDLANVPAETYNVIISDTNNCSITKQIIITQPLSPLTTDISWENVKCFGGNDGSANLTAIGGTPPYSFLWSTNDTTEDLQDLFSGNYSVTVIDSKGCSETDNVFINQPAAPLSNSFAITHVNCFGFSDGNITVTNGGGTTPYQYKWSNSQFTLSVTNKDLLNYPADSYYLTITDSNNCKLKDTAIIDQPPQLTTTLTATNILCFGDSTGAIDLTVGGGVAPHRYNWSNGAITEDLSNLKAGKYKVEVHDFNNCLKMDSIELIQPLEPLTSFHNIVNTTCYGFDDGSISYDVTGGTAPYKYSWSSGDTLPKLYTLTAGSYVVNTTDKHMCTITDSLIVNQPGFIDVDYSIKKVTCYGHSDGGIDITVSGGTPNYHFSWTNSTFVLSSIKEDLDGQPADIYTVNITDTNGCIGSKVIELPQPDLLTLDFDVSDISCFGKNDGRIDLTIKGGTMPYLTDWSNGIDAEDLSGLSAGIYHVSVSDSNNCQAEDSIQISEPQPLEINYEVESVSCSDQQDGKITLAVAGGTPDYNYEWSNGELTPVIENLEGGSYTITVFDLLQCESSTTIEVPVNNQGCLEVPTAFTPNGDGKNDFWIMKNVELYPSVNVRVFNKWGRVVFESKGYSTPWDGRQGGQQVPAGTYYYIIDLKNGESPASGAITIVR